MFVARILRKMSEPTRLHRRCLVVPNGDASSPACKSNQLLASLCSEVCVTSISVLGAVALILASSQRGSGVRASITRVVLQISLISSSCTWMSGFVS